MKYNAHMPLKYQNIPQIIFQIFIYFAGVYAFCWRVCILLAYNTARICIRHFIRDYNTHFVSCIAPSFLFVEAHTFLNEQIISIYSCGKAIIICYGETIISQVSICDICCSSGIKYRFWNIKENGLNRIKIEQKPVLKEKWRDIKKRFGKFV